jgi:hypothetical protein
MRRFAFLVAALMALSACSPSPSPAGRTTPVAAASTAPSDGPPTQNGAYVLLDCEGEGGCPYKNWRVVEPTPLYAESSTAAQIIDTLVPKEWLRVERVETRLVPRRAVVIADIQGLQAGDVIYLLDNEGEGNVSVWRRGEFRSLDYVQDPELNAQLKFDEPHVPEALKAKLGRWVLIQRQNGQQGWVHQGRFECMGRLGGDEGCRD